MADEVAQAPATQGVDAAQAVVQNDLKLVTISCMFFALFRDGFSLYLLPFISPVRMFRLSSCCVPWSLAYSLFVPKLVFIVSLPLFFRLPRSLQYFAVCVLFFPSELVFAFRLARSSSFTC